MSPIALFDLAALVLAVAGLVVVLRVRQGPLRDVRWIVALLLVVACFDALSNTLEWSGITRALDRYEDYAQIALPLLFLFTFYGLLQALSLADLRRSEAEKTALEAQLLQSQKLEAVGRLAGGVAHDFNNLLTVITGSLSLATGNLHRSDPLRPLLEECDAAAERASKLTRQLLAFSRRQVIEPRPLDLNRTITALRGMLARLISEDVVLELKLAPELPSVLMDTVLLEQVLVNLVVNARDAMPQGGTITLSTTLHPAGNLDAGGDGDVLELEVRDTGVGMTAEVQAHIFEPFFTTKPVDRGTGLGLASVYGAVRQSRGTISVESAPEQGACFRIRLPAHNGPPEEPLAPSPVEERAPGGDEAVLVVEDDAGVRLIVERGLARLGYRVTAAASAQAALALLNESHVTIDLLITDVVMPDMNGVDLASEVTRLQPSVRVLFVSGYSDDVLAPRGVLTPGTHLLAKPFRPQDLARRVREILDLP